VPCSCLISVVLPFPSHSSPPPIPLASHVPHPSPLKPFGPIHALHFLLPGIQVFFSFSRSDLEDWPTVSSSPPLPLYTPRLVLLLGGVFFFPSIPPSVHIKPICRFSRSVHRSGVYIWFLKFYPFPYPFLNSLPVLFLSLSPFLSQCHPLLTLPAPSTVIQWRVQSYFLLSWFPSSLDFSLIFPCLGLGGALVSLPHLPKHVSDHVPAAGCA